MKRIALLGSTGSIGTMTLDVVHALGTFHVVALATHSNTALLKKQIIAHKPKHIVIYDEGAYKQFVATEKKCIRNYRLTVHCGIQGMIHVASLPELDIVVGAVVGAVGLLPVFAAIEAGHTVALANKEPLVIAGELLMKHAAQHGATIFPVDSEHSAIFQCLMGEDVSQVEHLWITASGGPFYRRTAQDLKRVTIADTLKHPRWKMGKKITVDSATLMNKGLELIEARHLFNIPLNKINVVIHPESIVHSMVAFVDGSIKAQLGVTDMRMPIQFALTYPHRMPSLVKHLDVYTLSQLHFAAPDIKKFPCLGLALGAAREGGSAPVVLNAANEIAVAQFLEGKRAFHAIPQLIERVLEEFPRWKIKTVDDVIAVDTDVRKTMRY